MSEELPSGSQAMDGQASDGAGVADLERRDDRAA
jgi:hypothetical protein